MLTITRVCVCVHTHYDKINRQHELHYYGDSGLKYLFSGTYLWDFSVTAESQQNFIQMEIELKDGDYNN